jgi:hypothetical protein
MRKAGEIRATIDALRESREKEEAALDRLLLWADPAFLNRLYDVKELAPLLLPALLQVLLEHDHQPWQLHESSMAKAMTTTLAVRAKAWQLLAVCVAQEDLDEELLDEEQCARATRKLFHVPKRDELEPDFATAFAGSELEWQRWRAEVRCRLFDVGRSLAKTDRRRRFHFDHPSTTVTVRLCTQQQVGTGWKVRVLARHRPRRRRF